MIYNLLDFLEALGVTFAVDWDGEVECVLPANDPTELVGKLIEREREQIIRLLGCRRQRALQTCVGGPLNGRPHVRCYRTVFLHHVRRGQWAAYAVQRDGRALFCGYESSEKKARSLAWAIGFSKSKAKD